MEGQVLIRGTCTSWDGTIETMTKYATRSARQHSHTSEVAASAGVPSDVAESKDSEELNWSAPGRQERPAHASLSGCPLDLKGLHRSRMIRDVYSRLMKYFALTYDVVENFVERRMPFRGSHLKMVKDAHERGEIVHGRCSG